MIQEITKNYTMRKMLWSITGSSSCNELVNELENIKIIIHITYLFISVKGQYEQFDTKRFDEFIYGTVINEKKLIIIIWSSNVSMAIYGITVFA